ncbi:MAG: phosphatidylglycerophosphatase A [Deltaproteobacteria bacterium]|nr:phosphatidylglycerophosphatase A [Deltaproteobacteria bacterium]
MPPRLIFPRRIRGVIVTWFGCGRVPFAPGTAGSLGALPLCWLMSAHADLWLRVTFALGMTAIAVLASADDQAAGGAHDPQYIVVDEVAGMLWSTLLIPAEIVPMAAAFVLFRILDVVKPYPASRFDLGSKTSQNAFRRGADIVLDDVAAGLYAMLLLAAAAKFHWI